MNAAIRKGAVPCLEIDCTGLENLLADERVDPSSIVSVFIVAPAEEIYNRLCRRGTETPEQIQKCLRAAIEETHHLGSYTYILTNNVLTETVNDLQKAFEGCLIKTVVFDDVKFRSDMKHILSDTI